MTREVSLFPGHETTFRPRLQLWFADGEDRGFGHGRMELFRLIDSMGSLSKAAQALGMSYRAAWGKIKLMEQACGVRLVCSQGAKRDGYVLTSEAHALVEAFERWFVDVEQYATERAAQYFPAPEMEQATSSEQSVPQQSTENPTQAPKTDSATPSPVASPAGSNV